MPLNLRIIEVKTGLLYEIFGSKKGLGIYILLKKIVSDQMNQVKDQHGPTVYAKPIRIPRVYPIGPFC